MRASKRQLKIILTVCSLCVLAACVISYRIRRASDEGKCQQLLRWQARKTWLDSFRMRHHLPRRLDKAIFEYEVRAAASSRAQISAFLASGYFTNLVIITTNGHPDLSDSLKQLRKLVPPCIWTISQPTNCLCVQCATNDVVRIRRALQGL